MTRCKGNSEGRFLPEFLNRVDEVIMFHPLDAKQIRKIVELQVVRLRTQIEQAGLHLDVTEAALDAVALIGYDPMYGARPLKRVIQQKLQNPLATELLRGTYTEGSTVRIDYEDGDFKFERGTKSEPAEVS